VLYVVEVFGVTQLHDVVYIVCHQFSTVLRFNTRTHQRLTDINVKDLNQPFDMAACEQTCQLYLVELDTCVWRVSADGADIKLWWSKSSSDTFSPYTLSVTSTRLLMTSRDTKQLMQLDADGNELSRIQLPDYMTPWHAVESPTGTFIISHQNTQLKPQDQISEVNTDGEVVRQFSGSRLSSLGEFTHVAVDSLGNVLVADQNNGHILLLNAQLVLRRVVVDDHQLNDKLPWRLCYREQTGQLVAGLGYNSVAVFDVLRR